LHRVAVIAGLVVGLLFVPTAFAQPRVLLMPGVTYDREVQFTSHGPVVSHVITAPPPLGLYSLRPVLANGVIPGRETVSSMERRVSGAATVAGINGDLFSLTDGHPTGIVMQDGVLWHRPSPDRSSIGIDSSGTLRVDRETLFSTWQGTGPRRTLAGLNEPPAANAVSLYTPAWGAATPPQPGSFEVALSPFAPALPNNQELPGVVVSTGQGGNTPIPPGGAVLVGRGTQGEKLAAEATVGGSVSVRLLLQPDWTSVLQAIGGGPVVVKNGKVIFRSYELFTPDQLLPRAPRTAIGQRADGKIVMLVVDGRQAGYSTGLSNYELGVAMQRLGCVTASALDSGGSSEMAFDGQVLNQPSDGGERAVKESLLIFYTGVYAPPPTESVVSPNGDAVAERQTLSYKVVRPSTVSAQLVGPDGQVYYTDAGSKVPGVYKISFPRASAPPLQGRWQWVVTATDDQNQRSSVDRGFMVNNTLGFLKPMPPGLAVPRLQGRTIATVSVKQPATILAWVESTVGAPIANIASGRIAAGTLDLKWNGLTATGTPAYPGRYVLHVAANNAYGRVQLDTKFTVVKARKKPAPARR
jgi:hypothetical protein